MNSGLNETQASPSYFAFADAWASSKRVRDLSSLTQALSRVWSTCFERYAVGTVDVLIHGADPYLGLLIAWRSAQQGKRVLLSFTSEMNLEPSVYRLNARRVAHLPLELRDYLRLRVFNDSTVTGTEYASVLTTLCNLLMSMRSEDGRALVHVFRSTCLSPDKGVSQNYPDAHIFWPTMYEQPSRDAAAVDLRTIHAFVARRLRPYRVLSGHMTVGYVRARHLVLTSRVPGYTQIPWRCRVTRLGAAANSLSVSDISDYTLRRQDVDKALSFVPGK